MIFLLHATEEYTKQFNEMVDLLKHANFNVFKDKKDRLCIMFFGVERLVQMSQILKQELIINTEFIKTDDYPTIEIYNSWRE